MKFGIVVAKENSQAERLADKITNYLKSKGHDVSDKGLTKSDLILTLGGDGTLLHAACENVGLEVPFVGINVGTLGFLTAAEIDDWQEAIDKLISGKYVVSERMTLETVLEQGTRHQALGTRYRALNEVVVKGMYRVIKLEINVNGQKFLEVVGDGVIVATQTGSTAYSLSSGGAIVDPAVDCFLITPINPIGLPIPSVALSPESEIEVKVHKGDDVSLIIDGQEHTKIVMGQSVKVEKGKYRVKFGYFDQRHFLKALNAKFGLSGRIAS